MQYDCSALKNTKVLGTYRKGNYRDNTIRKSEIFTFETSSYFAI